jgi:hypothetical protein
MGPMFLSCSMSGRTPVLLIITTGGSQVASIPALTCLQMSHMGA